jgi:hypothetical protein
MRLEVTCTSTGLDEVWRGRIQRTIAPVDLVLVSVRHDGGREVVMQAKFTFNEEGRRKRWYSVEDENTFSVRGANAVVASAMTLVGANGSIRQIRL